MGKKKVEKPAAKAAPKKSGECTFCKKITGEDQFCHGCKNFVCEGCEKSGGSLPFGVHDVQDHLQNHDLDEDEEEEKGEGEEE